MVRKRKKKIFKGKKLMLISSIAMLNFVGVSYASWNDNIEIFTSLSTGEMNISFIDSHNIQKVRGKGTLEVKHIGENTIEISGEVDKDYKAFLHYGVVNKGSIPVKFRGHPSHDKAGLKLRLNNQSKMIGPKEVIYKNGNPKLHIEAREVGTCNFTIKLPFKQWNR
ncbi:MAG: hypothetical protein FH753_09935 [Firmicutes bacterium]|nr:hypothetical protein [Bacillota bacterium]